MTIEKNKFFTMFIEWKVEPEQQQELIDSICDQIEPYMKNTAGFVSASFHASEDGRRVINYGQWQSKEDWVKFEDSNDDLDATIDEVKKRCSAETVKIDPFRVVRVVKGRTFMDKRPDRYRNAVAAHIYVEGAAGAITFYETAFGAHELFRVAGKDGKIMHGEIAICGSVVMIGDPDDRGLYGKPRKLGGYTAGLHISVDDNKALLRRAAAAGAEEIQPVTDMFYGASAGVVRDPFGHVWVLWSWTEDLDTAEIERRGNALLSQ